MVWDSIRDAYFKGILTLKSVVSIISFGLDTLYITNLVRSLLLTLELVMAFTYYMNMTFSKSSTVWRCILKCCSSIAQDRSGLLNRLSKNISDSFLLRSIYCKLTSCLCHDIQTREWICCLTPKHKLKGRQVLFSEASRTCSSFVETKHYWVLEKILFLLFTIFLGKKFACWQRYYCLSRLDNIPFFIFLGFIYSSNRNSEWASAEKPEQKWKTKH